MSEGRVLASGVVAIWGIFAVAVALLDWRNATPLYHLINAVGIAGLATGLAWLFYGRRWGYVCLAVSASFLLLTAAQWIIHIIDAHGANPDGGVSAALLRLVETWRILFNWRREKFGLGWALIAIYWDVVIVMLQLLVVAVLLGKFRKIKVPS